MKPIKLKDIIKDYSLFTDEDVLDLFKFGIIDGDRMIVATLRELRELREGKEIPEEMLNTRYLLITQSLAILRAETEEGEE